MDMAERDDSSQQKLLRTEMVAARTGSGRLFDEQVVTSEPVECLGIRFESEDARRAHFLERLKEYLPALRKRPDFPVGEDEDILRLSDPPYLDARWQEQGRPAPEWGPRHTILGDLSPAATFIAANYTMPFDVDAFARVAKRLLDEVEAETGWMYDTLHADGESGARINYTVWSEVFSCPGCSGEVVFLAEALDQATMRTRDRFPCPHCSALLSKDNLLRSFRTRSDPATGEPWQCIRFRPVLIDASNVAQRIPDLVLKEDPKLLMLYDQALTRSGDAP